MSPTVTGMGLSLSQLKVWITWKKNPVSNDAVIPCDEGFGILFSGLSENQVRMGKIMLSSLYVTRLLQQLKWWLNIQKISDLSCWNCFMLYMMKKCPWSYFHSTGPLSRKRLITNIYVCCCYGLGLLDIKHKCKKIFIFLIKIPPKFFQWVE